MLTDAVVTGRHDAPRRRRHPARGRKSGRAVRVADGTRIGCDLLVTAVGWTAPGSLLSMCGDRPAYSPRAASFVPEVARLPGDVLVTGASRETGRWES